MERPAQAAMTRMPRAGRPPHGEYARTDGYGIMAMRPGFERITLSRSRMGHVN
ncbi:MAG: hypothetical protein IPG74_15515 [Flavobacteriales bacterium]|nr:hypothetical protein [Flavobacteriales bacterium]